VAAATAGVPVVVAGLRGTREALRAGTWRPRISTISFEVGPVLDAAGSDWNATVRLRDRARDAMASIAGEFVTAS
jgi:1-acyl-sn-glycerol-3-phosphate acyltransferase